MVSKFFAIVYREDENIYVVSSLEAINKSRKTFRAYEGESSCEIILLVHFI